MNLIYGKQTDEFDIRKNAGSWHQIIKANFEVITAFKMLRITLTLVILSLVAWSTAVRSAPLIMQIRINRAQLNY
jgi:hypothetical protein